MCKVAENGERHLPLATENRAPDGVKYVGIQRITFSRFSCGEKHQRLAAPLMSGHFYLQCSYSFHCFFLGKRVIIRCNTCSRTALASRWRSILQRDYASLATNAHGSVGRRERFFVDDLFRRNHFEGAVKRRHFPKETKQTRQLTQKELCVQEHAVTQCPSWQQRHVTTAPNLTRIKTRMLRTKNSGSRRQSE